MLPPLSMASAQRQHHLHAQCRCCSLQGHQGLPVHKYLLFTAQVNAEGKSSCAFKDCPDSPTADVVRAFAESNQVFSTKMNNVYQTWMIWKLSNYLFFKVWMEAFGKVFAKMLAHGSNNLHDLR